MARKGPTEADIAYLRHALETKLLDPETRRQIKIVLAEHQKQRS